MVKSRKRTAAGGKKRQPSPEKHKNGYAVPVVPGVDSERVKVEANAEEDRGRPPKRKLLPSMDSSVNDTLVAPTTRDHDQSSRKSEPSTQISKQPERLPPARRQTRLYQTDRQRSPDVDRWSLPGFRILPQSRNIFHPDYPFTKKDPYLQPERDLPLPPFSSNGWTFDGFLEGMEPTTLADIVFCLQNDITDWVNDYCASPEDLEARMTAQQKQDVVDFLGDWCLYSDWDSLVATFPNPEARFRVFTKAVIMKDIFHSLVENPFYYMDSDTHWDGRSEFLPPRHGQELFQHWQKILRVDEASAEKWRASTVQMMNRYLEPTIKTWRRPIAPVEGEDTSAGIRSWNVRVRYVNQLVRHMLGQSSLISPMLSEHDPEYAEPTEYPFRRHGLLRRAYEAACNFGVQMWVRDQYAYRFDDDIKGIGPYTKRKDPERDRRRWRVSDYTRFRNIDYTVGDGFEGRRTVMILWPTIWAVSCKQLSFNPGHSILDTFERTYFDDKEWLYLDDREWFYETAAEGLVYLGKEFVEPEGNHQK